jgi:RND family efflux transporter MFP subunit
MKSRSRLLLVAAVAISVVLAVVGAVAMAWARERRESAQRERLARAAERGPRVLVTTVGQPAGDRTIVLPGDVRAFEQATLYAKVNGYVVEMRVDKGYRVRRGEVLARISSPETDHQVQTARAALVVTRRNAERARRLAPNGIVSRQELDMNVAALQAAEGEYRRVRALQEYEVLRAPFDGVVTARYVDPGALVAGTGQPLVDVAAPERVRVFVYVGQDVAPFVRLGDPGEITIDQHPGVRAEARVRRMADALDPRSRSMLVELWPEGDPGFRLVPGLFVHVALRVTVPPLPVVPSEVLVARGERLQAALVQDRKLHFVDVDAGVDDGRVVQIRHGLEPGQVVALSVPSDLGEGAPIDPVPSARGAPLQPGREAQAVDGDGGRRAGRPLPQER